MDACIVMDKLKHSPTRTTCIHQPTPSTVLHLPKLMDGEGYMYIYIYVYILNQQRMPSLVYVHVATKSFDETVRSCRPSSRCSALLISRTSFPCCWRRGSQWQRYDAATSFGVSNNSILGRTHACQHAMCWSSKVVKHGEASLRLTRLNFATETEWIVSPAVIYFAVVSKTPSYYVLAST